MIYKTNPEKNSLSEIPRLQHDNATAQMRIPQHINHIHESYNLMYGTIDPETLCTRYQYIKSIVDELQLFYEQGYYNDSESLEKYKNMVSDANYCALLQQCYSRYMEKARTELRTESGIQKRQEKFINYIDQNIDQGIRCKIVQATKVIPEKKSSTSCTQTEDTFPISNEKGLSDSEVQYLMQLDYQAALAHEAESKNPTFHRTEREDDLCDQFMKNHGKEIAKHINSFEESVRRAYAEKDLDQKIELLQKTIILFEEEKKWFYKTKGGAIYFQDFYEHLHNSHNDDFSYIDSVKDTLEYNLYIKDDVIPEIMQVITTSGELMQRDIYKHIPDIPKSIIQQTIRELEKDDLIVRTKKGNSYLLSLGDRPYKV